jgi:hypothetical protein
MGEACAMCGGEERCPQGFGGKHIPHIHHLQDYGIDGMVILKWTLKK